MTAPDKYSLKGLEAVSHRLGRKQHLHVRKAEQGRSPYSRAGEVGGTDVTQRASGSSIEYAGSCAVSLLRRSQPYSRNTSQER